MERIAVFAHFDKNNKIQDYVIYYMKELYKIAKTIIFVSDTDIQEKELSKINPYVKEKITGKHGEYDFGSYKKGFLYAKDKGLLKNCEELIFANDSCYAPLFDFKEMFNEMSKKNIDFWGVTENSFEKIKQHIQSYFLVFKKNVINSESFFEFMKNIKKEEDKNEIFKKYEQGLTVFLEEKGFQWEVYSNLSKTSKLAILRDYKNLIKKERIPFLKRSIVLLKEQKEAYPFFIKDFIKKYTKYNYELIIKDRKINRNKFKIIKFISYLRRKILKIHLKERQICLFGIWYCYSGRK